MAVLVMSPLAGQRPALVGHPQRSEDGPTGVVVMLGQGVAIGKQCRVGEKWQAGIQKIPSSSLFTPDIGACWQCCGLVHADQCRTSTLSVVNALDVVPGAESGVARQLNSLSEMTAYAVHI